MQQAKDKSKIEGGEAPSNPMGSALNEVGASSRDIKAAYLWIRLFCGKRSRNVVVLFLAITIFDDWYGEYKSFTDRNLNN